MYFIEMIRKKSECKHSFLFAKSSVVEWFGILMAMRG